MHTKATRNYYLGALLDLNITSALKDHVYTNDSSQSTHTLLVRKIIAEFSRSSREEWRTVI